MLPVVSKVKESSMMLWSEVSRLRGTDLVESNLLVGTSLLVQNVCQAEVVVVVEQVLGFMVAYTDGVHGH